MMMEGYNYLWIVNYIWASMQQTLSSGFPKRNPNQSPQLQRLARKILLVASLDMILSKKQITAASAQADLGLCCVQTLEDRFSRVQAHFLRAHRLEYPQYVVFPVMDIAFA